MSGKDYVDVEHESPFAFTPAALDDADAQIEAVRVALAREIETLRGKLASAYEVQDELLKSNGRLLDWATQQQANAESVIRDLTSQLARAKRRTETAEVALRQERDDARKWAAQWKRAAKRQYRKQAHWRHMFCAICGLYNDKFDWAALWKRAAKEWRNALIFARKVGHVHPESSR